MRTFLAATIGPPPTAPPPIFPVGDWQFWIVTTVATIAAVWLLRKVLLRRIFRAHRRAGKPATLTIGGRAVVRGSNRDDCHKA